MGEVSAHIYKMKVDMFVLGALEQRSAIRSDFSLSNSLREF